eukprot:CAMPEP_0170339420 /NCGR_PEP_ID=MMETSP0116_2-20130129/70766_1 /TAXON_ID=400756 /ORGANISM="Durinskia baltica, Strain CSIRO CS-38" /LENGTH=114 /DNA_ID=CAMNT_0010592835 /DNA_START=122 /DNA_END=466 /DNA_ORIENTATION=+
MPAHSSSFTLCRFLGTTLAAEMVFIIWSRGFGLGGGGLATRVGKRGSRTSKLATDICACSSQTRNFSSTEMCGKSSNEIMKISMGMDSTVSSSSGSGITPNTSALSSCPSFCGP